LTACDKKQDTAALASVAMEPVTGTTLSALLADKQASLEDATRLALAGGANARYLMLMAQRMPAITHRIDALVRPQCGRFIELEAELSKAPTDEAKRGVLGRWKGQLIVVIGTLAPIGEKEQPGHVATLRTVGSIGQSIALRFALPQGEHAERLRRGGLFKLAGTVLPRWPEAPRLVPYPVHLSVTQINDVP
jgi:hypothetical protein